MSIAFQIAVGHCDAQPVQEGKPYINKPYISCTATGHIYNRIGLVQRLRGATHRGRRMVKYKHQATKVYLEDFAVEGEHRDIKGATP